jgi:hypothetical protein
MSGQDEETVELTTSNTSAEVRDDGTHSSVAVDQESSANPSDDAALTKTIIKRGSICGSITELFSDKYEKRKNRSYVVPQCMKLVSLLDTS